VQLQLIGPGRDPYRDLLYERAIEAGVADRLMICPAVPPTAVIDSISDADVGLMLIEPVCRSYELTLPNKLFEYAAAGLPILASDMPVIAAVVRDEGLGEVVPPDDIQLIAEALLRLVEPAHNAEARERVRRFAARVTWDSERQTLERVYQQVSNA
jgi:glycosyltransferase involved in cell wall biosynthesis